MQHNITSILHHLGVLKSKNIKRYTSLNCTKEAHE